MYYEVLDISPGGQSQKWLIIYEDERIVMHIEPDSYSCERYSDWPFDVPVTLSEIRQRSPRIAVDVEAALARVEARAASSSPSGEGDGAA
jgi:hypothetical protein